MTDHLPTDPVALHKAFQKAQHDFEDAKSEYELANTELHECRRRRDDAWNAYVAAMEAKS